MAGKTEKISPLVKKYELDNSAWVYKGFHGIFHTFFPVGQGGSAKGSFLSQHSVRNIFFVHDNYVHWYWNEDDLTFIREEFFGRLRRDKNYLKTLEREWQTKIKSLNLQLKSIDNLDLSSLSDSSLIKTYRIFYQAYIDEFKYFMALGDAVSMPADTYLVPEFAKALGQDFSEVFPKLLTTKYLSFIEEEGIAREKLASQLASGHGLSDKSLARHAAKYFYISNNYARGVRLNGTDFLQLILQDLSQKPAAKSRPISKAMPDKQRLIKKYRLTPRQKMFLYVIDEFFKIQDTRKKYVLIANYYQFEFLKEISRRTGVPSSYLNYSVYPEVPAILKGKIGRKELAPRRLGGACLHLPSGYHLFFGRDYQALLKYFFACRQSNQEIKGFTASRGCQRGRVKKILKIHDMVNMEKGDILVTSMTRPEMVPAMRLASAIITDEGGITSHAAIISRELKIPCLIGTKNATQILNDGDEVEVDANRGVVKILKRR